MKATTLLLTAALALGAGLAVGCAHAPAAHRDARRLRVLEASFHEAVAQPLASPDDIEPHIARVEALRLEYLDALSVSSTERDRLLALLRLAELHLDASARIRRVPYPKTSSSPVSAAAFDQQLSARALPLEATGLSLLEQIVQRGDDVGIAEDAGVDGRFVRRARLYLRLHTEARLEPEDVDVLRAELLATTYRAPRSLLDTGRIGQRAARR